MSKAMFGGSKAAYKAVAAKRKHGFNATTHAMGTGHGGKWVVYFAKRA